MSQDKLVYISSINGLTYTIDTIGKYTANGFICKLMCNNPQWEEELNEGGFMEYINPSGDKRIMEITKVQVFNKWIYLYLDYSSALECVMKVFNGRIIDKSVSINK